jgi:hypothetical protein
MDPHRTNFIVCPIHSLATMFTLASYLSHAMRRGAAQEGNDHPQIQIQCYLPPGSRPTDSVRKCYDKFQATLRSQFISCVKIPISFTCVDNVTPESFNYYNNYVWKQCEVNRVLNE